MKVGDVWRVLMVAGAGDAAVLEAADRLIDALDELLVNEGLTRR